MTSKKGTLTAGFLAIGNELLDGIVLETNCNWMETQLVALGVEIRRLVSVRDEIEEIGKALQFVRETCDVIITSGGLGPTHDDMTLKSIAQALKREVVEDPVAIDVIKRQYKMLHQKKIVAEPNLTDARRKMAQIPNGAIALDNRVGGAPGVKIQEGNTTIFCLPGVPAELKFIFEDSIVPWVKENVALKFYEQLVIFDLKDESVFAPAIDVVMKKFSNVYIKSLPKPYSTSRGIKVWVSARGIDEAEIEEDVKSAIKSLEKETGTTSKPAAK
ncbi:MAG: competence/damage-inducible protein A [Candidatus Thorarchaeota archaeon]